MLKIKKLTAIMMGNDEDDVLDSISLEVNAGEIHAIMGPKHSGKTAFAHAIMGNPNVSIKTGSIHFNKKNIVAKTIEERSLSGIFTSFQCPPVLDGVPNFAFVKHVLKARNDKRTPNEIEKQYKELIKELGLSSNHGHKIVNQETMTETECKKNELLHMTLLNPNLIILDEIDEGVETDEIAFVANYIKEFLADNTKAAIVITHNQELLDILQPTHVHIMVDGEIKTSGPTELYKRIVEDGYTQFS